MRFRALVSAARQDGLYVARYPSLPGCRAEGATREEAVERLKARIEETIGIFNKWVEAPSETEEYVDFEL